VGSVGSSAGAVPATNLARSRMTLGPSSVTSRSTSFSLPPLMSPMEKPRPMGIKGRGQLGVDVPVNGNALSQMLSSIRREQSPDLEFNKNEPVSLGLCISCTDGLSSPSRWGRFFGGTAAASGLPRGGRRRKQQSRRPIWKLEAAPVCRSCKQGRYAPPVHMIERTMQREITPHAQPSPCHYGLPNYFLHRPKQW
jgi:hypothetical protein